MVYAYLCPRFKMIMIVGSGCLRHWVDMLIVVDFTTHSNLQLGEASSNSLEVLLAIYSLTAGSNSNKA